ncbi:ferrous iron transport protein B [Hoylesella pleuritidis F0068]|jgi:ferrous iron transport protein B|uniref:Ferrous iron transport protein B n=2 Tax=Hoylesella pleuritidis TaxID=407975 RepID=U2MAT4_9BACT|nr:ferrous iron transport protein B [Hoylesella pleuritidis F0068]
MMRLSDLKTGQRGVIVKVLGHGSFRKRIVEMGFIKGKSVEVLLNAPLQDPVKYKIMGYEISLRRDEARMIEVISVDEALALKENEAAPADRHSIFVNSNEERMPLTEQQMHDAAMKKRRTINVALVGNPNCGKTSLFNFASGAHERVGNYSGVTVDAKEGRASFEGYEFHLVDLPGTYSLSAYSPEEMYVRHQILDKTPDIIINVIDVSNLERNLYLTTQLVDMDLRMVCALNMFDEFESRGDTLDYQKLGQLFGVPMIPTIFRTGRGVDLLFHIIINMYEGVDFLDREGNINPEVAKDLQNWHKRYEKSNDTDHLEDFAHGTRPRRNIFRHIHVNHGKYIEQAIDDIRETLRDNEQLNSKYSTRYLAIKLLENDANITALTRTLPNAQAVSSAVARGEQLIKEETKEDCETAIMDAKYGFIHGALQEAGFAEGKKQDTYQMTHFLDAIITHKYFGFPLFFLFLYIMFQATFSIGQYPMDWIDAGVAALGDWVSRSMPDGPVKAMLVDGVIGGVGAVIVFLPQILILYFFISFMEDSGYMARAAFIMDKLMHKMGLHGKSFIPLIMGFGCNVPAIMATRTIESRRSRLITMLVLPMMSCSARLPIYIMITGTFFALQYRSIIMLSLYAIGILMAVIISRLFSKYVIKGEDTPFVMELPPYRFPTSKAIIRHTWEKGKQYLKKMGGIILVASIIVWALGYFPHNDQLDNQTQQEQSYIGRIGKAIEPVFRPQGFDWKLDVGLLAGVGAKEIVASTMGVLYSNDSSVAESNDTDNDTAKYTRLRRQMLSDGITPLTAYSYLLFVLLYFPCVATIAAIKNESGSWKWALFGALYTTALAWIVSAAVYQVGQLFS